MTRCSEPWRLDDPQQILTEILDRAGRKPGLTHIAYVSGDPQRLRGVRTLATPTPYRGSDECAADEALSALSDQVREVAIDLVPERTYDSDRWSAMEGCLVTVVCREGRVVSTADESQFITAWRYSNHFTVAFAGDVFAVTPHGWTGALREACGLLPSLATTA